MNTSERPAREWRHKLPLILGIGTAGLLFFYLVLPGFIIGLLIRTNIIDPKSGDAGAKTLVRTVFFVPVFLAENVPPIGSFYEWQAITISGYR